MTDRKGREQGGDANEKQEEEDDENENGKIQKEMSGVSLVSRNEIGLSITSSGVRGGGHTVLETCVVVITHFTCTMGRTPAWPPQQP